MNKAVFITGAQTGTGYAIAELFAQKGWDVFITSRRKEKAEAAAKKISDTYGVFSRGYACDIGNEQQVVDIFKDIDTTGRFVETVVLNAANLGFNPNNPAAGQDFWTVPVEEFRRVFETNLVWNFAIIRQAAVRMREKGKGSVVFISSNTAYRAIPNRAAYSASKGGINSLAKALAVDLGQYGIRCNVQLKPNAGWRWAVSKLLTENLPLSAIFPISRILPMRHGSLVPIYPKISQELS